MLEFYKVNANYDQLADDVLGLLQYVSEQWFGSTTFVYRGKTINLSAWEIITVAEAFAKHAGITEIFDEKEFIKQARDLGYTTEGFEFTEVFSQVYSDKVEDHLGRNGKPTLIKDYPRSLGATARWNSEKGVAERWEFYIEGIELGNAANEQADHLDLDELQAKYRTEMQDRNKNKLTPIEPDLEFAQLLKDLPNCSGIGIGLERLCTIFLDLEDIRELKVSWVE